MNRNEEYALYVQELEENAPPLDTLLDRAKKRRLRRRLLVRPIGGLAAVFAVFVILVNVSAPVASACSQIPILRELAEAVTFSRSLSDAVENEYAQIVDQEQTENGITATVEYLIVDRKRVYIFFRLDSFWNPRLSADAVVEWEPPHIPGGGWPKDEKRMHVYSWMHFSELDNGLCMLQLDLFEDQIPEKLDLTLQIYEGGSQEGEYFWEWDEKEREYLAEPKFTLEIDPMFFAPGKIYELNQPFELDGQRYTVTGVEVYPTCMYVDLAEDPANTMQLRNLSFYIETDNGQRFDRPTLGTFASGISGSESMLRFYMDSIFFHDTESFQIVITGASFLNKEEYSFSVNLLTGETEDLPEGIAFQSAREQDGDWLLTLHSEYNKTQGHRYIYGHQFYDAGGKEYSLQWTMDYGEPDKDGEVTYCVDVLRLQNYPYEEVWLTASCNARGVPIEPIVIPVP